MLEVPLIRKVALNRSEEDLKKIIHAYENFEIAANNNDAAATLKADKDYHSALLDAAHIERALVIIENTRNAVLLTGPSTIPYSRTCMEAFLDHQSIHEAILNQDADRAENEMKRHIINTANMLITQEAKKRDDWIDPNLLSQFSWIHK